MRELIHALISALTAAGLQVTEQFPALAAKRLRQPTVAVSIHALRGEGSGLADYLGETEDGAARYGKRFAAELLCRVAAPEAQHARETAETVCAALLGGAAGFSVREIVLGEMTFDAVADCFRLDVTAGANVYLYAERSADDTAFLNFRLECETI